MKPEGLLQCTEKPAPGTRRGRDVAVTTGWWDVTPHVDDPCIQHSRELFWTLQNYIRFRTALDYVSTLFLAFFVFFHYTTEPTYCSI